MPKVSEQYLESRRRSIVAAARREFARRGFAVTSMADLVAATGLSMGALYRYFPSKTELILAVVEGRDGQVDGEYDATETPAELLSRLAEYVRAGDTDAGSDDADSVAFAKLVTHVWSSAATDPAVAEVAVRRHAALRDHLMAQLADEAPAATSGDGPGRAEVALAALVGYAALTASGYPLDHDAFVAGVVATVSPPST